MADKKYLPGRSAEEIIKENHPKITSEFHKTNRHSKSITQTHQFVQPRQIGIIKG
jgi:hypothetical protein